MKICILSTVNIKHMTLISLYTSYFEKNNMKYDLIYIDKYDDNEESFAENTFKFPIKIKREWSFFRKLMSYWKFKKFAEDIVKKEKYDFIIVWNTYTAIMFSRFLIKKYKNRYSVNIRDYGYEKNPFIFRRVRNAIQNSTFNTISSKGFETFLPENNYVTVHSFNKKILSQCIPKSTLREKGEPIRITFIGYVRFFEKDKQILDLLGNDERYIIQYFGEGANILEQYAINKGYSNVKFHDRFEPQATASLLNETDVINNLYGVGDIALDTAISIKMYYAVFMNLPILVFKDTYMEKVTKEYNIGFSVDKDMKNLANEFYEWYHELDSNDIVNECNRFKKHIKLDNKLFEETLMRYFPVKNRL